MMKKMFTVLLAIIPFLGAGQKAQIMKKAQSDNLHQIDVYTAFKNVKAYKLSTVAEDIEYIPLERTSECIISGGISKICISSEDIFVFDFNLCYRFNRQGKFRNRVGRIGRGPGECNRPTDIAVDTINQWVYLLDLDKMVKYNYDGSFVKAYKLGFKAMRFVNTDGGLFFLNDMFYSHADPGKRFSVKVYKDW